MELANYHTHTSRCNHATGTDLEYLQRAIQQGLSTLGFSDHTPWPYTEDDYTTHMRMDQSELDSYVKAINGLKQDYRNEISVEIGLEAEYFPQYINWLKEQVQRLNIDYVILGNHYCGPSERFYYYGNENDVPGMHYFVETLGKAIDTGLYRYVAHPDLIFCQYPTFDANCVSASRDILQILKERNMPMEYNVSGTWKTFKGMGYPCPGFWEMAQDYPIDIYIGFDAHEPSRIDRETLVKAASFLRAKGFNVLNA